MTCHIMHPQLRFPYIVSMKIFHVEVVHRGHSIYALGTLHYSVAIVGFEGIACFEVSGQYLPVFQVKKGMLRSGVELFFGKPQLNELVGSAYKSGPPLFSVFRRVTGNYLIKGSLQTGSLWLFCRL